MTWWNAAKYNRIGKTYGRLTVLEQVSDKGGRRYLCQCECGNYTEVAANNLVTGNVVSCGCARFGGNKLRPFEWLYNRLTSTASERNIPCDLTYDEFIPFTKEKECHYCGCVLVWTAFSLDKGYKGSYKLDRKDSDRGYTKENCVVCCTRCNRSKSNSFTYDEWVAIGKVIKSFAQTN